MVIFSGCSKLCFDSADFLVAHFHLESVTVQNHERLFQGCPDRAYGPLPVLFLQDLGGGKLFPVRFVVGGLHPEFKLRCGGQNDFADLIRRWDIQVSENIRVILKQLAEFLLKKR